MDIEELIKKSKSDLEIRNQKFENQFKKQSSADKLKRERNQNLKIRVDEYFNGAIQDIPLSLPLYYDTILDGVVKKSIVTEKDIYIANKLAELLDKAHWNDVYYYEIRCIGWHLWNNGGERRMSNILDIVRYIQEKRGNQSARLLEMFWNHIGTWLG